MGSVSEDVRTRGGWIVCSRRSGSSVEEAWIAGGNLKDWEPESSGGFFTQIWHLYEEGSKAGLNWSYQLENLHGASPARCPPSGWAPYVWLRAPRSSFPAKNLHGLLCSSIIDHLMSLPLSSMVAAFQTCPNPMGGVLTSPLNGLKNVRPCFPNLQGYKFLFCFVVMLSILPSSEMEVFWCFFT